MGSNDGRVFAGCSGGIETNIRHANIYAPRIRARVITRMLKSVSHKIVLYGSGIAAGGHEWAFDPHNGLWCCSHRGVTA